MNILITRVFVCLFACFLLLFFFFSFFPFFCFSSFFFFFFLELQSLSSNFITFSCTSWYFHVLQMCHLHIKLSDKWRKRIQSKIHQYVIDMYRYCIIECVLVIMTNKRMWNTTVLDSIRRKKKLAVITFDNIDFSFCCCCWLVLNLISVYCTLSHLKVYELQFFFLNFREKYFKIFIYFWLFYHRKCFK